VCRPQLLSFCLLPQVRALMGQESVADTLRYEQLPLEALQAAQGLWLAAVTGRAPVDGLVEAFVAACNGAQPAAE
jgi:hypothetical protein